AFFIDPADGELTPASRDAAPEEIGNAWLDFRIGHDHLPLQCCDCLQPTSPGFGFHSRLTKTLKLEIPRCPECASRARQKQLRIVVVLGMIGLVLVGAIGLLLRLRLPEEWIFAGVGFLLWLFGAIVFAAKVTTPARVRERDRDRGVVRLRFRNPEYTGAVAKHLNS